MHLRAISLRFVSEASRTVSLRVLCLFFTFLHQAAKMQMFMPNFSTLEHRLVDVLMGEIKYNRYETSKIGHKWQNRDFIDCNDANIKYSRGL